MTTTKPIAFALIQTIIAAGLAQAETPTTATATASAATPSVRDWTVSFALETYVHSVPFPLLGVEVAYHPIARLAFAAQLTTLLIAVDLSAQVRYFLVPVQLRSGLYASLAGHTMISPLGSGNGGALEIGYEKQLPGGLSVGASGGVSLLLIDSCSCGRDATQRPWAPIINLRMGKAF